MKDSREKATEQRHENAKAFALSFLNGATTATVAEYVEALKAMANIDAEKEAYFRKAVIRQTNLLPSYAMKSEPDGTYRIYDLWMCYQVACLPANEVTAA